MPILNLAKIATKLALALHNKIDKRNQDGDMTPSVSQSHKCSCDEVIMEPTVWSGPVLALSLSKCTVDWLYVFADSASVSGVQKLL